jgi:hypothetical protein
MSLADLIRAYKSWIEENIGEGKENYLITFQFIHLSTTGKTALEAMMKEIERFYAVLLTNVTRRPRRASQAINLPRLIALPDRPVAKRVSTYSLGDIRPNDGLHVHALLAIPKVSRLQEDLVEHIRRNRKRYRGNQEKIKNIDVRPVVDLDGRLVDYTFKHLKRGTFSLDDILILPRSKSELEPKARRIKE